MPVWMNTSVFPTHQMPPLKQSGQILPLIPMGFGSGPQLVLTGPLQGGALLYSPVSVLQKGAVSPRVIAHLYAPAGELLS